MATTTETDKIRSTAVPQMIADAIRDQLAGFTSFSNPSLGYYGVKIEYTVKATLYARGEETVMATKETILRPPDEVRPIPAAAVETVEVATGSKMAGRKPSEIKRHQPTEGTTVVPPLPPVPKQIVR